MSVVNLTESRGIWYLVVDGVSVSIGDNNAKLEFLDNLFNYLYNSVEFVVNVPLGLRFNELGLSGCFAGVPKSYLLSDIRFDLSALLDSGSDIEAGDD